jgi:hypothetical protein
MGWHGHGLIPQHRVVFCLFFVGYKYIPSPLVGIQSVLVHNFETSYTFLSKSKGIYLTHITLLSPDSA